VKILFLIDSLHSIAAGSERQIYKLIDGLVASGHNVCLELLRHTEFTRQLKDFPCPSNVLGIQSIASVNAIKIMLKLRRHIIREKIDVVHAYFPDACVLAPLFLKTADNLLFTSRRDMGLIYQGKPAWIYSRLASRTDAVISNSKAVSDFVAATEKLPSHKSEVIYNGLEQYLPPEQENDRLFKFDDSIKLVLVANIKPVKRTLDAVIAVSELIQEGHKLELTLVGEKQDHHYATKITEVINEKGSGEHIRMTGSFTEPRRLLSQAHLGLLVSESEGLSNTIMEYMHAELSVIATNVGGNPELVIHNHNGLLIDKGNIEQLKAAILLLATNENLRSSFGRAGKLLIQEKFSIAALIKQHETLYTRKSIQAR
jgi:glycosyltransferase involved in cell wall biosynthesis